MGSPRQLSRAQVQKLKAEASGAPAQEKSIRVSASGEFSTELPLRENDVYLLELSRDS